MVGGRGAEYGFFPIFPPNYVSENIVKNPPVGFWGLVHKLDSLTLKPGRRQEVVSAVEHLELKSLQARMGSLYNILQSA